MAKLLGIEIKVANIQRTGLNRDLTIDVNNVLLSIANTARFKSFASGTEEEISHLKQQPQSENIKDEIAFLEEEVYKMPFFLIKKWLKEGKAEKEDILQAYGNFEKSNSNMKAIIERILVSLNNEEYKSIGSSKDEETLKKKFDWMINKFGLGESRAKELLPLLI